MEILGLVVLLVLLVLLGQPLFVIMGSVTAYCFMFLGEGTFSGMIEDMYYAADKEILLAIPLFILAGNIMTYGSIAQRLINMGKAYTAAIPSGLAISGVFACAIFAAISGSSPVTLIAIGGIMYPALRKANYPKSFSMGLLASGGTLGIIIPPSIPMIIYAIMVGVSVTDLFKAGIGPGILLVTLLIIYSMYKGWNMPREKFSVKEVLVSTRKGILALLMPIIILGGIYSGFFTATESAAVAVVYALLVELAIHRELKFGKLPTIFVESAEMLGSLLLILLLAVSLNKFLTIEQVPQNMVEWMTGFISSPITFIIGVNILLLIVGFFMDIMSAILVLAPLLAPMAASYGINPIHFGIIMIVNLEIGYITPPVGINLFVAQGIFKESLADVIKSVIPIIGIFLVALMLISFIPQIALFPLSEDAIESALPEDTGTDVEKDGDPGGSFLDKFEED
ncbi:MAG: TRAP transporter large permease [Leptospira sp.]|nr:TRAP transporter large permease [Leptospira sp.]